MISPRSLVWVIPMLLFFTFPLWQIPLTAFLTPRGGYDSSLAERELDQHKFNMTKVNITQSEQGQISLEVQAESAHTGATVDEFQMEKVDAVIIAEDREQTFVTAREGTFDKNTGILTLTREVVITKPKDNFELYTELLIYNNTTHIAHSPGATQIIGEKIDIRGKNLIYNTLTNAYELDGRVRCRITSFNKP